MASARTVLVATTSRQLPKSISAFVRSTWFALAGAAMVATTTNATRANITRNRFLICFSLPTRNDYKEYQTSSIRCALSDRQACVSSMRINAGVDAATRKLAYRHRAGVPRKRHLGTLTTLRPNGIPHMLLPWHSPATGKPRSLAASQPDQENLAGVSIGPPGVRRSTESRHPAAASP